MQKINYCLAVPLQIIHYYVIKSLYVIKSFSAVHDVIIYSEFNL